MSLLYGLSLILAGIAVIIILTSWFKLHSFLSLFLVSLLMALIVLPTADIVPVLKKGFGDTMASVGLIIVFGTVIGVTLDFTGATVSMANYILSRIGKHNAPAAISITGFITGLPIFCDSGFIVLSGLNRSLTSKGKINPVFMTCILACSLYSVHCLIPPHPGATAAAGIIGANIGRLVVAGIIIAIPTTIAGYLWIRFITRNIRLETIAEPTPEIAEIKSGKLPSAGISFMPIFVPLILITGKSLVGLLFPGATSRMAITIEFVGEPIVALLTGMFLSFFLLPSFSRKNINYVLTMSVEKAGPIIYIIAAGGIFGAVIKSTGVGEQAGLWLAGTGLGLMIPFLVTFFLKTAQGSSTVAIITAASIMGSMLDNLGFAGETGRLLVMLSMGAGSMMVSHANDAYFWVITNFSKIESGDTLKVYSTATIVMGFTALAMVFVLSLFLL
jgi:GntP family gluconate:H+ symporter